MFTINANITSIVTLNMYMIFDKGLMIFDQMGYAKDANIALNSYDSIRASQKRDPNKGVVSVYSQDSDLTYIR